jgi:membrane-bound ClpP family serine protease
VEPLLLIFILFAAAAALLAADLFIPSGGILSVIGAGLVLTAIVVCFTINQWLGLAVLFGTVVSSPFVAMGLIKAWRKTPVGKAMFLEEQQMASPRSPAVRVGATGKTLTALRPMGEAEFASDLGPIVAQAKCELGDLPPDAEVTVVHYKDGVATVRPCNVVPT